MQSAKLAAVVESFIKEKKNQKKTVSKQSSLSFPSRQAVDLVKREVHTGAKRRKKRKEQPRHPIKTRRSTRMRATSDGPRGASP